MNICFMCDLHLSFDENALQYDIAQWAIADILRKKPDCIVFAGDVTGDGGLEVYRQFINKMQSLNIPFLYIPGNSDLRCKESRDEIRAMASEIESCIEDVKIYALNDCEGLITDEQFSAIENAEDDSIVFMHHPAATFPEEARERFERWRAQHKNTMVFYGHLHRSIVDENTVSLQAMDPDKAIGENPCITYFDTQTRKLRKAYYFSPVPTDIHGYLGISCYNTIEDVLFSAEKRLKTLELRPQCIKEDRTKLVDAVEKWRISGGENLSIHFPDVQFDNGNIAVKNIEQYIELANQLKIDRITQHVPKVSVGTVKNDPSVLDYICDYMADKFNAIDRDIVVGVENMHMTGEEIPDETRRFGYTPEECILYAQKLENRCRHKVGINLDIGHARNNAPYSQKYQISTWLSQVGKYVVGYHIHQVTMSGGKFHNHMPITDIYGKLISFASLFKCWSLGKANKAPVIMEMRPEGSYKTSLQVFNKYKDQVISDIHTHTYYSNCGTDDPKDLIEKAIEHGISILGICDHNYGIGDRKARYIEEMRGCAEKYKDKIRILCGIEIATIPHIFDIEGNGEISNYDYCLIEHITDPRSIVGKDLFAFCKKLGITCGIAHTDMFEYCDIYGYDYEEFFRKMADNNIFWEMNVSFDSIHKYREHQYVADFISDPGKIEIVKKTGVCVSVGSDCHRCNEYCGHPVHEMYDFLISNGIKTIDKLFQ